MLSLAALSRWSEAEALAWQWRDRWPRLRELFIEIAIAEMNAAGAAPVSADLVDRLTSLVEADRSPMGAQALAWRGFAAQDYESASRWFKSALDWAKPEQAGNLDVIRAYAISLRESHKPDEALRLLGRMARQAAGLVAALCRGRTRQFPRLRSRLAAGGGEARRDRRRRQQGEVRRRRGCARLARLSAPGIRGGAGLVQAGDRLGARGRAARRQGAGRLCAHAAIAAALRRLSHFHLAVEGARREPEAALPGSRRRKCSPPPPRAAKTCRSNMLVRAGEAFAAGAFGQWRAGARLAAHIGQGLGRRRGLVPGRAQLERRRAKTTRRPRKASSGVARIASRRRSRGTGLCARRA